MRTMYHGWSIHLISESNGYSYQCWDPQQGTVISDRRIYSSLAETLKSARQRADLEAVSLSLIRFLNGLYGHCYYLTTEDHSALTASIAAFVQSASQAC